MNWDGWLDATEIKTGRVCTAHVFDRGQALDRLWLSGRCHEQAPKVSALPCQVATGVKREA